MPQAYILWRTFRGGDGFKWASLGFYTKTITKKLITTDSFYKKNKTHQHMNKKTAASLSSHNVCLRNRKLLVLFFSKYFEC